MGRNWHMGEGRIQIMVSCANSKSLPIPPRLRVGSLRGLPAAERLPEWTHRLATVPSEAVPARNLYRGAHWQGALQAEAEGRSRGLDSELWVLSAGYGLVAINATLRPYSATFRRQEPDSVVVGGARGENREAAWWDQLAKWEGPASGQPRSIAELARDRPSDRLIVAAGADYVRAVAPDLVAARDSLRDPSALLIVSAGMRAAPGLNRNLLPIGADLQPVVRGSNHSLNVRVLRWILARAEDHRFDFDRIVKSLDAARSAFPAAPSLKRIAVEDATVRSYIRDQRHVSPRSSASYLLRSFRADGWACEQGRFKRLYREAVAVR